MFIKTENLTKDYETGTQVVSALKGINLSVEKGEFLSIMGPSGSGKTTLMNIIGCLDSPTNGSYYLNNKSVSKLEDDELAKLRNEEIVFVLLVVMGVIGIPNAIVLVTLVVIVCAIVCLCVDMAAIA